MTWDKAIELYKKQIEKLKQFKKICLKKMFPAKGQTVPEWRFKGFADDWERRVFTEFARRVSTTSSARDLPRIEYEDIVSGTGLLNKDVFAKQSSRTGVVFNPGDVLYGKLRPYLQNWYRPDFSGLAIGDFWVLHPENIESGFLYRLIQGSEFNEIVNRSTGTKMPRADWKLVSKTIFSIPALIDEQVHICNHFNELEKLITLYQRKLEAEQKRRKALQQYLLNGIVRVDEHR